MWKPQRAKGVPVELHAEQEPHPPETEHEEWRKLFEGLRLDQCQACGSEKKSDQDEVGARLEEQARPGRYVFCREREVCAQQGQQDQNEGAEQGLHSPLDTALAQLLR